MHDVKDLLDRLDAADDRRREHIWCASRVELTPDDVKEAARADRPCMVWLVRRYDVGPPGRRLPDALESRALLLTGAASAEDAYAAIFTGPVVESGSEVLRLLHEAAAAALANGADWLGTWLASRAALAWLASGDPVPAWEWFEVLESDGDPRWGLETLRPFLPVRGHADIERSAWVRVAACFLWPRLKVPLAPALPFPDDVERPLPALLSRLDEIGATDLGAVLQAFVRSVRATGTRSLADHPLVQELERRALTGEGPPEVDQLPEGFDHWARLVAEEGRLQTAYLAGRLLHVHGRGDRTLATLLVLPLATAADLPLLAAGFDAETMHDDLAELQAAARTLPDRLGDALVAAALPRHVHGIEALGVLLTELEALAALRPRPGGLLDHVVTTVREVATTRERDRVEARPGAAVLCAAVRSVAERLGDPRQLTVSDVERAAASITPPEITLGVLEVLHESESSPIECLLQALVLLPVVDGTPHESVWGPGLRQAGSQALWQLGVVRLFDLRVRLLDELIRAPGPLSSLGELHFQRANSRRALGCPDAGSARLIEADLLAAERLALSEEDIRLLADAVGLRARIAVDDERTELFAEVGRKVDEVLGLRLPCERRSALLQAKAHLVRAAAPGQAADVLAEAIALLPQDDPFRCELGAERVCALISARRPADAVAEARALAASVTEGVSDTVLTMIHQALGDALELTGDLAGARAEYGRALERSRGVDERNAAAIRVRFARLALRSGERALWTQHFTVLHDRWETLPVVLQGDLVGPIGEATRRGWVEQASADDLMAQVVAGPAPLPAVLASLYRARTALDVGVRVDLDTVLRDALRFAEVEDLRLLVLELAYNHGDQLGEELLGVLAERAARWRRPAARARVLQHLGRLDEALASLEAALVAEGDPEERLRCVHLLITSLDAGQRDRRLAGCDELEDLLSRAGDYPEIRADLAQCLRMVADGDEGLLERAWSHGTRALEGLRSAHAVAHCHRVLAHVVDDLARARLVRPGPRTIERARWLVADHPLPHRELAERRYAVAYNLLVAGPLCHPAAVEVSERLLELVVASRCVPDDVGRLQDRASWVRDITSDHPAGLGRPGGFDGPADHLPAWLVRLVAGREVRLVGAEIERDLEATALALHLRPDAADRVLARLVRMTGTLSPGASAALFQWVYQEVSGPMLGPGAWKELESALGSLKARNRPRLVDDIRAAIERARGNAPRVATRSPWRSARVGSRERAEEAFQYGVELMRTVHGDPLHPQAVDHIRESRQLLEEAVGIARRKKLPHLPDILISLGNAWKMPPEEDVGRALGLYEEAARRDLHPEQEAKLWKVQGDALRRRGRPDDLRRAFGLLIRSAQARIGWERAESFISAAEAAKHHPDLQAVERIRRAAALQMEAVRADAGHAAVVFEDLLRLLGEWQATSPADDRPESLRRELSALYPQRVEEIDRPVRLPSKHLVERIGVILTHPACVAYMQIATRLFRPDQAARDPYGMRERLGARFAKAVEERHVVHSMLADPDGMEEALGRLRTDAHPGPAAAGVALARARLLAELCRCGRTTLDEVRQAGSDARVAVGHVEELRARAFLMRELAAVWSASDHADDPVRDYALAVELAREAMQLEGGEAHAATDTVELVARSLRYSPCGDLAANLGEARRLYRVLVERARTDGDVDLLANALHCLADAETQSAEGDRLARLRAGAALIEEAARITTSAFRRAQYTTSLGWQRTRTALQLDEPARMRALRDALATFDSVDTAHLEAHEQRNHRLNRAVCLGSLERETRGRLAEVEVWRAELVAARAGPSHHVAILRHNLANALVCGEDCGPADFAEGIELCELALRVRTLESDPRHHWETTLLGGRALARLLDTRRPAGETGLPWPEHVAWEKSRRWLRQSITAARALGPGEELAEAACALASLARSAAYTKVAIDVAEEAWRALRDAMPFLLLHGHSAAREAGQALDLALFLAWRLAAEGVQAATRDLLFVMDGDRARLVLRWLVRSYAPVRRGVVARLSRPAGVGLTTWGALQDALARRDPAAITRRLMEVRDESPSFLGDEVDLGATWRWLGGRPGAVAVTVLVAVGAAMVTVLSVSADGRERVQVLAMPVTPPPVEPQVFWHAMAGAVVAQSNAAPFHDAVAEWARRQIVDPVLRYLGGAPTAVLWCPSQILRLVAPTALWGRIPVALALAPALPDLRVAPPRGRSTLVVLSDPTGGGPALGGMGLAAVERVSEVASERGAVQVLASAGTRHGRELAGPRAISRPASAEALLDVARDHDVLVLVAHGEAPSAEGAAILLVDIHGAVERLDVPLLSAHPGAFTGATILLLSCETGKVGMSFHDAGGVAGALIAAGARAVIAPLWPVRLDVAEDVARAVLEGMVDGREPHEVLASLQVAGAGAQVVLGPAPSPASQAGVAALQRCAFVSWVG